MPIILRRIVTAAILAFATTPALAHSGHTGGLSEGFIHPLLGLDHILAMVAVGIWAAIRSGPALWTWPTAFVLSMLGGFTLAPLSFSIPFLETMIASSVILLGAVIAFGISAPIMLGGIAIAIAGAAHGFAHGLETQGAALAFAGGFVISTTLLHLTGIALTLAFMKIAQPWPVRAAGAAIALTGFAIALM